MTPSRFKIIVAGDAGVGKSTFIQRHLTSNFNVKYEPTLGVDVHPLHLNTTYGPVVLDLWDTAGQEKYGGLGEKYSKDAKGLLVMYDINSGTSYKHVAGWIKTTLKVSPEIPVVVCGNKSTKVDMVFPEYGAAPKCNATYFDISVKDSRNLNKPLEELARKLMGYSDLEIL